MAVFLYNIFLLLYQFALGLASPFNVKAKKWVQGRKNIFGRLAASIQTEAPIVWVHCASLGEFEQGRTIIEALQKDYPQAKILLTFFSPSGYEAAKNYGGADWIFYLPMDGALAAKRFLEIVNPSLVIFVKYEFWYYYLKKIKYRNIPLLLVSALFRPDMSFFKWYGGIQRKMLSRFDHLFVQNGESKKLIDNIGLGAICSISGDTRFDRVAAIARNWEPIRQLDQFINEGRAIVAGSTWEEDERVLQKTMEAIGDPSLKLIIAPHEVGEKHLQEIESLFPDSIRFSRLKDSPISQNILIIDNIGMLSRLYNYGQFTYVGGGLRESGVHNVLEAAVFNKIVFYGPNYHKYKEAEGLALSGGGMPFDNNKKNPALLAELIKALSADKQEFQYRSKAAGDFVRGNQGATTKIMEFIYEKRLLTS